MKTAKLDLASIRAATPPFQKNLLEEVWQHFHSTGKWKTLRQLFADHGYTHVREALSRTHSSGGGG